MSVIVNERHVIATPLQVIPSISAWYVHTLLITDTSPILTVLQLPRREDMGCVQSVQDRHEPGPQGEDPGQRHEVQVTNEASEYLFQYIPLPL